MLIRTLYCYSCIAQAAGLLLSFLIKKVNKEIKPKQSPLPGVLAGQPSCAENEIHVPT